MNNAWSLYIYLYSYIIFTGLLRPWKRLVYSHRDIKNYLFYFNTHCISISEILLTLSLKMNSQKNLRYSSNLILIKNLIARFNFLVSTVTVKYLKTLNEILEYHFIMNSIQLSVEDKPDKQFSFIELGDKQNIVCIV